jgi:2-desacetyl-2-hydroxyethyl bacteriochlorophyllide A dehydrogenase
MRAPAIVFAEPKRVEVREMAYPEVGPVQLGIRTVFSGISQGTERWALTGRYGHFDRDYSAYYPCSPGYQAAGVVEEVGSDVRDIAVGDHVFGLGTRFDDSEHHYPGPCQASHSAYLVIDRSEATKIDQDVDLAGASLYHMAGVSRHGVRLTKVQPNDVVAVIGLGMIGQMSGQAARRAGARVIGTDLIPARVEAAAKYSVDRAIDANVETLEDVVKEETGDGADVVIDTTGDHRIFDRLLGLIHREGRIAMQGYYPEPILIDFHPTHMQRPTVTFPCGWDDEFNDELAEDMATGRISLDPLITHRFSFRDAQQAYDLVIEHPEQSLAMVFDWAGA